jgi:hypothetical protein
VARLTLARVENRAAAGAAQISAAETLNPILDICYLAK